jgi:hypothetical protein
VEDATGEVGTMRKTMTFQEMLHAVAADNGSRVMQRAAALNRLAKAAPQIGGRMLAYEMKRRTLEHAIAKFPDRFSLSSVEHGGALVCVAYAGRIKLHLPTARLQAPTRSWLATERRRVVASVRRARIAA